MAEDKKKNEEVEAENAEPVKKVIKKKGKKQNIPEANLFINASYNNTIVTVTEMNGNVLCWSSAGSSGFKGSRKATPYAASIAVENALNKAKVFGVERVHVAVNGVGNGRDQALRSIGSSGIGVESIRERTSVPHNGCRPRKARRV